MTSRTVLELSAKSFLTPLSVMTPVTLIISAIPMVDIKLHKLDCRVRQPQFAKFLRCSLLSS